VLNFQGLTFVRFQRKIRQFRLIVPQGTAKAGIYDFIPPSMTPSGSTPPPEKSTSAAPCKHPRVRIVAREEDAEFVECLECSEVFESSEFKDMSIEESKTEEG
jgi:hypothetical protein